MEYESFCIQTIYISVLKAQMWQTSSYERMRPVNHCVRLWQGRTGNQKVALPFFDMVAPDNNLQNIQSKWHTSGYIQTYVCCIAIKIEDSKSTAAYTTHRVVNSERMAAESQLPS